MADESRAVGIEETVRSAHIDTESREQMQKTVSDAVLVIVEGMRVAEYHYRKCSQKSRDKRSLSAALHAVFPRSVYEHLTYREAHGKRQRYRTAHAYIVSGSRVYKGDLRKERVEILSEVIIVDGITRQPHIVRGQFGVSYHGHHKAVVHEFLLSVYVGEESFEEAEYRKGKGEDRFLDDDVLYRAACLKFGQRLFAKSAGVPAGKGKSSDRDEDEYGVKAADLKICKSPYKKSRNEQSERFAQCNPAAS